MNEFTVNKDKLTELINGCNAIKDKYYTLELMNQNPDQFIRTLFCLIDSYNERLESKEDMLQDALRECTRLQTKCSNLSKDMKSLSDILDKGNDVISIKRLKVQHEGNSVYVDLDDPYTYETMSANDIEQELENRDAMIAELNAKLWGSEK